uniref:Uncharacterized protein n=1 Tax=Magallana gigas TaxID=29159 RepID=K1PPR6_MAGGI
MAGKCAGVPYERIQSLYRASLRKPKSWKQKRCGRSSLTDGDVCCPTSISAMCPEYLTNTNGTRRIIVHFPDMKPDPMYQFIPRGLCQSGGNCQSCRQEFALLNILVVDETFRSYPPLEFDSFYIHKKKRDHIKDLVEFLEDKHGTMSDYSLIDNLRDLTNLVSNTDSDIERGDHSVRYRRGDICEGSLDSIMGQTFDLDDFSVTETDSFQYGDKCLDVLEAIDKDICLQESVNHTEGGLLVTFADDDTETFHPDSKSRRLLRHVTLTGDVIREYEYQEDGQTRLFTLPYKVRQNGNTDICVVNSTSQSTGELAILSSSGFLKSVYHGQKLTFDPSDVVFDSHCNIIVSNCPTSQIHLLSPDGKFMKYLLTENEVKHPYSMSLYKSTLWVGDNQGLIKVFQLNTTQL